jgi:uncharacterized protein YuzE
MMEMRHFPDTDTLLINFTRKEITETRDINENIVIELDGDGQLVSMTIEHAKQHVVRPRTHHFRASGMPGISNLRTGAETACFQRS